MLKSKFGICLSLVLISFSVCAFSSCKVMQNWVSLNLNDEMWVQGKQLGIELSVEYVGDNESVARKRQGLMQQLKSLAAIDWHVTNFYRNKDSSDLIRHVYIVEGRIDESQLNKITEAMKKMSKPGTKYSLRDVDLSPSFAEMQSAKGALRQRLYQAVQDEVANLNNKFKGQQFIVKTIKFRTDGSRPQKRMAGMLMATASNESPMADSISASKKLTMSAYVVLTQYKPFCGSVKPHALAKR